MKKKKLCLFSLIGVLAFSGAILVTSCDPNSHNVSGATLSYTAPSNCTVKFNRIVNGTPESLDISNATFNEGDKVNVYVVADNGYVINKVTFNGEIIRPNANVYSLTFVSGTNTLEIDIRLIETTMDMFTFELDEETQSELTLVSYTPNGDNPYPLIIPDTATVNGKEYPVTSIASDVFSNSDVASIRIGKNLTNIDGSTFFNAYNLSYLEVNEENPFFSAENGILYNKDKTTIISVPRNYDCNGTFNVKDSVTTIGDYAFCQNRSIETFNLGTKITSIGNHAFENIFSLPEIKIPDTCKKIGDNAFANCTSLLRIDFGEGLEEIGAYAFESCTTLLSLTIPDSLVTINDSAFTSNKSLMRIYFSEEGTSKLETIGPSAFQMCNSLKGFTAPSSLRNIGVNAFFQCESMTEVTLNEGLYSIGDGAFCYCNNLKALTIPSTVTVLEGNPFYECPGLDEETLIFSGENPKFKIVNGAVYSADGTVLHSVLPYSNSISNTYEVLEGTKIIAYRAFCIVPISKVIIPTSVSEIQVQAFMQITGGISIEYKGTTEEFRALTKSEYMVYASILSGDGVICSDGTVLWTEFLDESVIQ